MLKGLVQQIPDFLGATTMEFRWSPVPVLLKFRVVWRIKLLLWTDLFGVVNSYFSDEKDYKKKTCLVWFFFPYLGLPLVP